MREFHAVRLHTVINLQNVSGAIFNISGRQCSFYKAHFRIINKSQHTNPFFPSEIPSFQFPMDNSDYSSRCVPGLYLLLKEDQKLSTAKLWRAAAWPLGSRGDCCARFQRVCERAALKSPAKAQPKGAPASPGPYFSLYIQAALINQSVCDQQWSQMDGDRRIHRLTLQHMQPR